MAEEARISVRQHRKEAAEGMKELEKKKALSEDESHRQLDKIQEMTDQSIKMIDEITETKTKEVLTV